MSELLERLRKVKTDRGIMANLRCLHVESKRHRAWPALSRLGVAIDDDMSAYVAGLFAVHPEETPSDNFGTTCKKIERKRGDKRSNDSKLTPTERRFQHLLAAETSKELKERLLGMVLMARSQGVPINYERLEADLKFWKRGPDRTRIAWATAFWTQEASLSEEEDL